MTRKVTMKEYLVGIFKDNFQDVINDNIFDVEYKDYDENNPYNETVFKTYYDLGFINYNKFYNDGCFINKKIEEYENETVDGDGDGDINEMDVKQPLCEDIESCENDESKIDYRNIQIIQALSYHKLCSIIVYYDEFFTDVDKIQNIAKLSPTSKIINENEIEIYSTILTHILKDIINELKYEFDFKKLLYILKYENLNITLKDFIHANLPKEDEYDSEECLAPQIVTSEDDWHDIEIILYSKIINKFKEIK